MEICVQNWRIKLRGNSCIQNMHCSSGPGKKTFIYATYTHTKRPKYEEQQVLINITLSKKNIKTCEKIIIIKKATTTYTQRARSSFEQDRH